MQTPKKKLTNDETGILFFIAALLFGGWFRIHPALTVDFPINDGGLFLRMIETIKDNRFHLPTLIEFNGLEIPFAYPPFAFYLAAAIGTLFDISTLDLLIWIPALTLILTLPVVYYLVVVLVESQLVAGVATFIFAVIPRSLTWMIMGGGVTRSLGQLFLILAASQIYLLYRRKEKKYLVGSIVFSAAVCITHPEASLHTIAFAFVFWVFHGRNATSIKHSFIVGLSVLLLTAPWWGTVLSRHGLGPIIAASRTGFHDPIVAFFVFLPVSEEPFITHIAVLGMIGLFFLVSKGRFLFPVLYILPFFVEPRNAPNVVILSLAIMATIGLINVVLPNLAEKGHAQTLEGTHPFHLSSAVQKAFLAYFILGSLLGMANHQSEFLQKQISTDTISAFEWVEKNTPEDAEFLLITGSSNIFMDHINEWFPILAHRRSHTTIQGYEWLEDTNFEDQAGVALGLQDCTKKRSPDDCIESIAQSNHFEFDYIQIQKQGPNTGNLVSALLLNPNYKLARESSESLIFERLKK